MVSKLDWYRIFYMVGQHESISKAAKALYMTQPAVSQAIMQLEDELGIRLFHRSPRGVALTNEGRLLFEYVHSALNLINAGEEKILEVKNLVSGELKIGVSDTISRYFLLPYLDLFHNRYSNIKIRVTNGTTLEICELLKAGEVDLGICNFPIDDDAFVKRPCFPIHDIFVCGEKYKKLLSQTVTFEQLQKLPLIFLEPKSNSRLYVENFFRKKGIELLPEFELGSHDLLLEFAQINLGISCVTREFAEDYLRKGLVFEVKLEEDIPPRSVGFCYLKSVPLSPASLKFVEIIERDLAAKRMFKAEPDDKDR